jgi:hypothetical protein
MDIWIDARIDACIGAWIVAWMVARMDASIDACIVAWMAACNGAWMVACIVAWIVWSRYALIPRKTGQLRPNTPAFPIWLRRGEGKK